MTEVILVAVNDSPAAFIAVDVAIEQARRLGATLHAVMVVDRSEGEHLKPEPAALDDRRELAAHAVLRHVSARAEAAGVDVHARRCLGRVAAEILSEARRVHAVMIVMACVDRPGHAIPTIGSHTLHVLEFSTVPVLVVPSH